ncbi:Beta-fructofuranosidase, insoluble isoenzyme 1, partial [Glycine soja]
HLFYQYNPKGTEWDNIVWAHSVSKDLINWNGIEHAIYPSKPFDKFGCWSGSATIVPEDPNDPLLRRWVKPDRLNPVVVDKDANQTEFRDPTTAWWGKDGHWRMLVGSPNTIHSMGGTGMWECPDFYPVSVIGNVVGNPVKHVLKNSLDDTKFDYYTVGTYLEDKDSSSLKSDMYKPQFAGFVDVDLAADKKIFLRSLIDHSVVESFGAGGKANILSRVYPELAVMNQAYLFVFNNGTEPIVVENLKAWSMISADIK